MPNTALNVGIINSNIFGNKKLLKAVNTHILAFMELIDLWKILDR